MKRLKSIDSFRGLFIIEMIWVHAVGWWLVTSDLWLSFFTIPYIDRTGGPGFIFVAGLSVTLYVRSRRLKAKNSDTYSDQMIKNEYFLRALLLFIFSISINIGVAIMYNDISQIWTWFIILNITVSLFLAWPLLKTSKLTRLVIAMLGWIANYLLFHILSPHEGQFNLFGVLFHFLFNSIEMDPLFFGFSFLLIGTVIGDQIFDIYQIDNQDERRLALKNKLLLPSIIIGAILIIPSIINGHDKPYHIASFPWIFFSLGVNLIMLAVLLGFEEFELIKTEKSYRFLYYFSFYSLTIYVAHDLLYFVFLGQLHWYNIYFFVIITIILVFLLIKAIYHSKWRNYPSIKLQIGRIASGLTMRIEERKKIKNSSQ